MIKIPVNPEANIPYTDLVCTDQDKACIEELIVTIGENGKFSLLLKQDHLKYLGAQINHVHPIKFLAVGVASERRKTCLLSIFDDYFKRNAFMDGLGPSLSREMEKNNVEKYLPEFSEEIGVSIDEIQPYFQSRNWEDLVRFLIQQSKPFISNVKNSL